MISNLLRSAPFPITSDAYNANHYNSHSHFPPLLPFPPFQCQKSYSESEWSHPYPVNFFVTINSYLVFLILKVKREKILNIKCMNNNDCFVLRLFNIFKVTIFGL